MLTFAGALTIVVIIAAVYHGIPGIAGIHGIPGFPYSNPAYVEPADIIPIYTLQEEMQVYNIPKNTNLNTVYVGGFGGYPVTDFPRDMVIFGASDPEYPEIWRPGEIIQFATYTGPGNGFSEMFHIPFSFWRINATMTAYTKPESSQLTWIVVDGETGEIVTGNQMRYGGIVQKTVQASGESFYIMVSAQDVDRYTFSLETTKAQYGNTLVQPAIHRLTSFLNAA